MLYKMILFISLIFAILAIDFGSAVISVDRNAFDAEKFYREGKSEVE